MGLGILDFITESASQIAYSISKDGFGKAIGYNANAVAHSAVYNKMAGATRSLINVMDDDAANAVRSAIKKGDFNFQGDNIENALKTMRGGDEAAQKAAEEFSALRGKYLNARQIADDNAANALGAYADVLGRENGKILKRDALSGYFLDKQHGGTRIGTTLATGAGVGVATRFLSGGSLTRTASGESDIAGIPFF